MTNKGGRPRRSEPLKLLPIKLTSDLHRRFRQAAFDEGMTYAEFIAALMDMRDAKLLKRIGQQRHPLDVRPALFRKEGA